MNEKYTHNILGSVFKDGELFALTQGEAQATRLCIELNALHEENEQLKNNIGEQGVKLDFAICETQDFKNKWLKLKKENEQLKKRLIKLKEENVELKEENEKLWCDEE